MSTFTWIDHSEKPRRQILDAIDLFRKKDTRDELSIAGICNAFSDMLFPGTDALQKRARFFFFVPWMHLGFEAARVSSAEVARKGRAHSKSDSSTAWQIHLIPQTRSASRPVRTCSASL